MTGLDVIVLGMEKALETERLLGHFHLTLAGPLPKIASRPPSSVRPIPPTPSDAQPTPAPLSVPAPAPSGSPLKIAFLHDKPLSPAATELMSRAVKGLGYTPEQTAIVTELPLPSAAVFLVLGGVAARKFAGALTGRISRPSISPETLVGFARSSAVLDAEKRKFWLHLKGARQLADQAREG